MSLELARAWVRVRGDSSMLYGDLGRVRSIVVTALRDARAYALGLLYPLSRFGSDFIDNGKAIVNQNEQIRISFETLTGSASQTQKLMEDIIEFAARTPFGSSQLFQTALILTQFGERGQQVMKTLKMLGDASMGSAEKFYTLSYVFNQIRGVGHLITQDFRQLSTRGIISLRDLANHFGVTDAAAQKMLTNGQIKFEDLRDALEGLTQAGGRYFNGMARQSQSMIGLMNTLSDTWGILASQVAEVTVPFDRLILKLKIDLVEALRRVTDATDGFAAGMVIGAVAAAKFSTAVIVAAIAVRVFNLNMGHLRIALKGTGIVGVIIAVGAAIGGLVYWFSRTSQAIAAATESSTILGKAWKNIKDAVAELYRSLQEGFVNVWGISIPDALNAAASATARVIVQISKGILWLSQEIKFYADMLSFLFRHAGDLMMINLLDIEIGAILLMQDIEQGMRDVATEIMKIFAGLGAFIKSVWEGAGVEASNWVVDIKNKVLSIRGEFAAMKAGIAAAARGGSLEEITAAMDDAKDTLIRRAGGYKKKKKFTGDPVEAFKKAYENEEGMKPPEKKFLQDQLEEFQRQKAFLEKKIQDEENARRDLENEPEPEEVPEDPQKKAKEAMALIETGRYGFAEFGEKLQDAILRGKSENNQLRMIDLLGQGNQIQGAQLNLLRNQRQPGLGP